MKKVIFIAIAVIFITMGFTSFAQQNSHDQKERPERPDKNEQQEIIIRSKGDTNISLKVEINGEKVTINGKSLGEFKDDGIDIIERKMIVRDGDETMTINLDRNREMDELPGNQNFEFDRQLKDAQHQIENAGKLFKPVSFLGVTAEKFADGAKIVAVSKGSAAGKAGLLKGDIITKIDKEAVTDADVLAKLIAAKKPKDEIHIYYSREGKKKDSKIILGETNQNKAMNFRFNNPHGIVRGFKINPPGENGFEMNDNQNEPFGLGGQFGDFFPRQKKLGLKIQDTEEGGNVKIIEVADSSAAQKAGLIKNDLITEINGQKVENTDQAREQLQEAAQKSVYIIKAKRNGTEMNFNIKFSKKLKTADL